MLSWQETYRAAVLETDSEKLEVSLAKTEGLMFLRMQELAEQNLAGNELEEINAAWQKMSTLRFERLGWPNYKTSLFFPQCHGMWISVGAGQN
jgi:hypothetical protein